MLTLATVESGVERRLRQVSVHLELVSAIAFAHLFVQVSSFEVHSLILERGTVTRGMGAQTCNQMSVVGLARLD